MFRLFYYVVLMMLKRKFLVSSVIVFGSGICYDAVSDRHEQQNQYELQYRFHFVANIRELFFLVQPFPANLEYLLNSVRFLCIFIKKSQPFCCLFVNKTEALWERPFPHGQSMPCAVRGRPDFHKSLHPLFDALHGLRAVFPFAESRQAQVSFAARSEAHTGCAHYVYLIEQLLEECP